MESINLDNRVGKPIFNERQYLNKLPKSDRTGQFKIQLEKECEKDLTDRADSPDDINEVAALRIFYWAAFNGKENFVIGYMILMLKWSPFIKSF